MSEASKNDKVTSEAPDAGNEFRETAAGIGLAATKALLTPLMGLGLMGIAANDAIATGVTGAYYRAGDLLGKTNEEANNATAVSEAEYLKASVKDKRVEPTKVEVFDYDDADFSMLRKEYLDKG
eukprot:15102768-Ditylum_brightwellii.AAC.1